MSGWAVFAIVFFGLAVPWTLYKLFAPSVRVIWRHLRARENTE